MILATMVAVLPSDVSMSYNQILLLPAVLILSFRKPASTASNAARVFALALLVWAGVAQVISAFTQVIVGQRDMLMFMPLLNPFLAVMIACAFCIGYPLVGGEDVHAVAAEPEFGTEAAYG